MESPIVAIILFLFMIIAVINLNFITTTKLQTLKVSMDEGIEQGIKESSNMEITSINCSSPHLNKTTVLVMNIGRLKLHPEDTDVFFEDRFPRDEKNRSIYILNETDILDPGLWNPKEVINITLYNQLENESKYKFTITNEHGVSASASCNSTWD